MKKNYSFMIRRYVNGRIDYASDNSFDYPTLERAIEAARFHAENWKNIIRGTLEDTEYGAVVYAETADGTTLLTFYEAL